MKPVVLTSCYYYLFADLIEKNENSKVIFFFVKITK